MGFDPISSGQRRSNRRKSWKRGSPQWDCFFFGSGLHTFVLYLGPHIALFTIKAMKCGRVDLKTAPYDTIQFKSGPSWLEKDCSEFGPPLYPPLPGSLVRVPVSSLLPQVQLEAILWGLGTAVGELPPYFISRAACLSGSKVDAMDELDAASSKEDRFISASLKQIKRWLLSHVQHLNFFTILVLASELKMGKILEGGRLHNGLYYLSTNEKKFFSSLCNNQLLELVENELIWVLGLIPGFSSVLPNVVGKLQIIQEKYLSPPVPSPALSDKMAKRWNPSFSLIWNPLIWLMLMNFFVEIVTATAQGYLKKQQDSELTKNLLASKSKTESST